MAMLSVDKVADASEFTEESFRIHGPEVDGRFAARWTAVMPEDKPPPSMVDFLEFLSLDLRTSREGMVERAQDHESELGLDSQVRTERNEAHAELNTEYLDMRTICETLSGKEATRAMGFTYPRSEHPFRFRRQVAMAIRYFQGRPREEPIATLKGKEHLAITAGAVLDSLEPPYERLKAVLTKILVETRKSQKSQNAKAETYDGQVRRYSTHAKCGEMLYRMVGLDKFADQIKPSVRRPGQRAADNEGEEDPPASSAASAAGPTGPDSGDGGPSLAAEDSESREAR